MTGEEIDIIIDDFSRVFGEHDRIKVILKATPLDQLPDDNMLPRVSINKEVSTFSFCGDIQVMNPYDSSVPTLTIQYRFLAYLNFRIDESFKLYLEDDSIDATFLHF